MVPWRTRENGKRCPACGTMNTNTAIHCRCGYNFRHARGTDPVVPPADELPNVWWFFTRSWRIFGTNWRTFLILAAVPTVILPVAAALALGNFPSEPSTPTPPWAAGGMVIIITIIVMTLNTLALITAAHRTIEGEPITVGESYALALNGVWDFVWTGFLYVLIVLGGLVLFVIPGIVLAIGYFASPYLVVLEGISGRRALSRSTALSRGRKMRIWWREMGCGILFSLTLGLATFALTVLVAAVMGDLPAAFAQQKPLWAETIELYGNIVSQALFVIFNVLLIKCLQTVSSGEEVAEVGQSDRCEPAHTTPS